MRDWCSANKSDESTKTRKVEHGISGSRKYLEELYYQVTNKQINSNIVRIISLLNFILYLKEHKVPEKINLQIHYHTVGLL